MGEGVKPDEEEVVPDEDEDESPEGEEAPADPAEKKDTDSASEEEPVEEKSTEEEVAVDATPAAEKPKVIKESVDSLEATKSRLLEEIKELRGERRTLKGNPFDKKSDDSIFVKNPKAEEDPLTDVNSEDRALIERVVEARLKSEGYVKKDELRSMTMKEKIQAQTDAWLATNPEFDKDNDPEDEKWNKINAFVSRMFAPPSRDGDVKVMLDMAKERLFGKKTAILSEKSIKSIAAKKEKIATGVKSASGSGAGSGKESFEKIDKDLLVHLKGFTEEELKELAS
jgi:hypothetical protein